MDTYSEGKQDTLSLNVDSSEFSTMVFTLRERRIIIIIILNQHEIKVKKGNGANKPRRPTPFCGIKFPVAPPRLMGC